MNWTNFTSNKGMKSLIKSIAIGTTVLYVLGVFMTAWHLIVLPDDLMFASAKINKEALGHIQPVLNNLLIITSATLGLGMVALIIQILSSKNKEANVVYVEKTITTKKATAKLDEQDEDSYDVSAISEELLGAIRQAANGEDHPDKKLEKALRATCNQLQASQGAIYVSVEKEGIRSLELRAGYALMKPESQVLSYEYGEGLPGQVAKEGMVLNLNKVPDNYIKVLSGLGSASPKNLLLVPVRINEKVAGVVEVASFTAFHKQHEELVKQSFEIMARIIEESSRQSAESASSEEENLFDQPIER